MDDLGGKVAVVTGAGSGIGFALATALAAEGMKVAIADVEEPALAEAEAELREGGAEVLAVRTDVSDAGQVEALASATFERFGTAHVVCNNAGVGGGGQLWELTLADWQWVLGVNLWGVIHGIRAFVPRLVEQGEGHVVNTASMAGLVSAPMMGPYSVSKYGVVSLSETLAAELELAGSEVGVSVLCPGWVNTRIAEADRNRPESLRNPEAGEVTEEGRQMIANFLASGVAPADVAAIVVAGIKQRTLYLLTHDMWNDLATARLERILRES
jgi:NAD(P)-dependent dehydrogenase (short-subunit alcohol dehydrogenase family)